MRPESAYLRTGYSEYFSFPHFQYIASLDLDTFPETFCSAFIGKYDCEKGLFFFIRASVISYEAFDLLLFPISPPFGASG